MRRRDGRNISRTPSPRRNNDLPFSAPRLFRQNAVALHSSESSTRARRSSSPQELQSPTSSPMRLQQSPIIGRRMPFQSPLPQRRRRSRSPRRQSRSPRRRSRSPSPSPSPRRRSRSRSPRRQN